MKINFTLILAFLAFGLAAQPVLVKNIFPGDDASPREFAAYGDLLIFRAEAPDVGVEPWITDGTEAGTMMLGDLNPDPETAAGNSNPSDFIEYNGLIYFQADNGVLGDELWVTDGTPEGTSLLIDIQEGEENGRPFDFVKFNDLLYFTANDGIVSSELWSSDGTAAGTNLVIDIQEGAGPGNPNFKTVVGDKIYFTANDGLVGNELWVTDGTAEGTMLIKDIRDGGNASPSQYVALNGEVFFRANDGENGTELWKTDGTPEGTVLVKDINPGGSSSSPSGLIAFGGLVFFEADDGTHGDELWVTDGTEAGTIMVEDLNNGDDANPGNFVDLLGLTLVFTAESDQIGEELFQVFVEEEGNPLSASIDLLADINPGLGSSEPDDIVFTGHALYFSATTPDFGQELYEFPVTEDEPFRISDINPAGDSDIDDIIQVGNRLFFEATDGSTGDELWTLPIPLPDFVAEVDTERILSGDTLDLGEALISTTNTLQLILRNNGDGTLSFPAEDPFGGVVAPFTLTVDDNFEGQIDPNMAFAFPVSFTPTEAGEFFVEVTLITNDLNATAFKLVLKGTGIVPTATLEITQEENLLETGYTVDFGNVEVGMEAVEQFTISNLGNVPLLVTGIALDDEVNFFVTEIQESIPAGTQDTFLLGFRPNEINPLDATLTLNTNANEGGTFVFNLTGIGDMESSVRDLATLSLSAFPNPVRDRLNVTLGEGLYNGTARVYNAQGQLIWTEAVPNGIQQVAFKASQLAKGTYLLELRDGERRGTLRFIKQ
ncbi:ELWxxDGT repeat protein [Phaeodactylibacter sp.]|uniref:ELWxxDGT repeat protein n=1 Tax=Phaeodactylibacter sp. TaxID=1940289 RepID=UPI0025CD72CB|nr:ELWxxDGT repeat protein [Phaeodactylibacter sp.]MCI4649121.1 choice-of-anchor D domain-containing protein [Phaeodactylibacter sp.]MCI5091314.1 choice-of-anchor D domain-containing protein [Phaeodactylibacter sp.]